MSTTSKNQVALRLPRSVPALLIQAKRIVQAMTNNPDFPAPTPSLAAVTAQIADVDAAETTVKTRLKGAADLRNVKLNALTSSLFLLAAYVQNLIDANEGEGAALIESAGMNQRRPYSRSTADLSAKMGPSPGLVILRARASKKRAAYEWEMSTDGGATWIALATTTLAAFQVPNLVEGSAYHFRVRTIVGSAPGEWTQAIRFLVH
jgi:hypothetical protein